jgi:hypothetical protein
VLLLYGWTIYWFSWNLPSWLAFLPLYDIFGILAYALVTNLLESLAVLAVLILLAAVLPPSWFRDEFVVRAGFTALYFLIIGMYLLNNFIPLMQLGRPFLITVAIFLPAQYLLGRIRVVQTGLNTMADRSIVFLYVSVPLSVLGLIVILVRNF